MFEIRYRGGLVSEHATQDDALAQVGKHHAEIQDKDAMHVGPSRPVRLYCRGNLAETFLSNEEARAWAKEHTTNATPESAWWIGTEPPVNPHDIWPIDVQELDVSDAATMWAEGQRPPNPAR